jgi:NitT/TauT family transport system permease protein
VRRFVVATLFFAGLLGLWQALSSAGVWNPVLLPSPVKVGRYLLDATTDGTLPEATLVTLRRLGIGFAIGVVLGIPLGFLTARSRTAADTLGVVALGFQTLPSVCWGPLAVVWVGFNEAAMLVIVVMGTLWSILLATEHGVGSVPPIYVRAARTMGSKRLHTLTKVVFPASLPFILSGMKQGWAFAWRSLMAAEIYITAMPETGLGMHLDNGRSLMAIDQVLGVMFVIVVVGLVIDKALFSPMERALHHRWGTGRSRA